MMLRNKLSFKIITIVLVVLVIGLSIWEFVTKKYTGYTYLFLGLMMISAGISLFKEQRKSLAYMYWVTAILILIAFAVGI